MRVLGGILFLILGIASIAFSVWLYFAAPCKGMSYLPAKEIPGRCLMQNN